MGKEWIFYCLVSIYGFGGITLILSKLAENLEPIYVISFMFAIAVGSIGFTLEILNGKLSEREEEKDAKDTICK